MLMLNFSQPFHFFRSHQSEFRFNQPIFIRTECMKEADGEWKAAVMSWCYFLLTSHVFFPPPYLQPCVLAPRLPPVFFSRSSRHQPDVKVCALPGNALPKQWHLCVRRHRLLPLHLSVRLQGEITGHKHQLMMCISFDSHFVSVNLWRPFPEETSVTWRSSARQ